MEKDIIALLALGKLPVMAVDSTILPHLVVPVYRAIEYLFGRGEHAPLKYSIIWKIAQAKYNATEEVREFLKAMESHELEPTVLDCVCQSLILKKISTLTLEQLATGQSDFDSLRKLLSVTTTVSSFISDITPPQKTSRTYKVKTGIPELDEVIGGVNDELVIVGARPKNGKSNFFFNMVHRNSEKKVMYLSCADYDKEEAIENLNDIDPAICRRNNVVLVDFTSFAATVMDVEGAVSSIRPDIAIVDRSEKLMPLRRRKEQRLEFADICDSLRRIAKRYGCPVFTDSQLNDAEQERNQKAGRQAITYSRMAEDHTQRAAVLDLFFGLQRGKGTSWVNVQGRRKGLPKEIEIHTDEMGRYI